jgi:hypothetical protein
VCSSQLLEILTYADDLAGVISSTAGRKVLIAIINLYGHASNAKINIEKAVVAISLLEVYIPYLF